MLGEPGNEEYLARMASNPNRSRDLLDGQAMKIWTQHHGAYTNVSPMDDKAREWLRGIYPGDGSTRWNGLPHWYGDMLVVPEQNMKQLRNKFVDAGGQLI